MSVIDSDIDQEHLIISIILDMDHGELNFNKK